MQGEIVVTCVSLLTPLCRSDSPQEKGGLICKHCFNMYMGFYFSLFL